MEPSSQPTEDSNTVAFQTKEPWHAPLNKVTLVSKILAAVVFITLPFVGFWLGVGYGKTELVAPVVISLPAPAAVEPANGADDANPKEEMSATALATTTGAADQDLLALLPEEFFKTTAIRPETRILAVGDLNGDGLLDAFAQDDYSPGQGASDHTLDVVLVADPAANKVIVLFPDSFIPDFKKVSIIDGHLIVSGSLGGVVKNEVRFLYDGSEDLKLVE